LQAASNGASEELVKALGVCKDAIGEWHDWEVLGAMASEIADGSPGSGPIEELASVREEKFNHALNLTQEMRKKYLRVPSRGKGRRTASRPSQEILRAVGGVVE
jgi:CHAD domain-containing protein